MKRSLWIFAVVFLSTAMIAPALVQAAPVSQQMIDKAKSGKKLTEGERAALQQAGLIDKNGRWIGGNKTAADLQGSKVDQGTVTPDKPPCRDLNYEGETIRPVNRSGGYKCPPGYSCYTSGISAQCRWNRIPNITADSQWCSWSSCVAIPEAVDPEHGECPDGYACWIQTISECGKCWRNGANVNTGYRRANAGERCTRC